MGIIVFLYEDKNNLLIISWQKPNDITLYQPALFRYLFPRKDVADWLKDQNMKYQTGYIVTGGIYDWYIEFENKEDAVLFKLTWC